MFEMGHSSQNMKPSSFILSGFTFNAVMNSPECSVLLELSLGREEIHPAGLLHTVGLLIPPAGLTTAEPFLPKFSFWSFHPTPRSETSFLALVASLDIEFPLPEP